MPEFDHYNIAIDLIPDANGNIDITESINSIVNDNKFTFNKVILFRKNRDTKFMFPEVFKFDKYIFIMKGALANDSNMHFYTYIRRHFSCEMMLASDTTIKKTDINAINSDGICLAIYYVFEVDEDAEIPEEHISRVSEMKVPEKILELMDKISEDPKEKKGTKREFEFTEVTYPERDHSNGWIANPECIPRKALNVKVKKH